MLSSYRENNFPKCIYRNEETHVYRWSILCTCTVATGWERGKLLGFQIKDITQDTTRGQREEAAPPLTELDDRRGTEEHECS